MWGLCVFEIFRSFQRPQRCSKTTLLLGDDKNSSSGIILQIGDKKPKIVWSFSESGIYISGIISWKWDMPYLPLAAEHCQKL